MVLFGGMRGFIRGGMCGFIQGMCMVLFGGVHGFIWGACVVLFGGMCGFSGGHAWFFFSFFGYNEIRSMSGRYASYWNAFLFDDVLLLLYSLPFNQLLMMSDNELKVPKQFYFHF